LANWGKGRENSSVLEWLNKKRFTEKGRGPAQEERACVVTHKRTRLKRPKRNGFTKKEKRGSSASNEKEC